MKTSSEIRMALIEKAGENEDFRARLLADAKSTVENDFGVTLPEGFSLQVHEENPDTAHLVLPPGPALSTEELATVSGAYANVSNDNDTGINMDLVNF